MQVRPVAQEAQHRRHAVDGLGQAGRQLDLGGAEGGADVDQLAQDHQVGGGIARNVAAVGQYLMGDLALEQAPGLGVAGFGVGQHQSAEDQPLDGGDQLGALQVAGHDSAQMAGLAAEAVEDAGAEALFGAGAVKVVQTDPVGDAAAGEKGRPGIAMPDGVTAGPAIDQRAGGPPGLVAAQRPEVAQPVEGVQSGIPGVACTLGLPEGLGHRRGFEGQGLTGEGEDTVKHGTAAAGVTRPEVLRHHGQGGHGASAQHHIVQGIAEGQRLDAVPQPIPGVA